MRGQPLGFEVGQKPARDPQGRPEMACDRGGGRLVAFQQGAVGAFLDRADSKQFEWSGDGMTINGSIHGPSPRVWFCPLYATNMPSEIRPGQMHRQAQDVCTDGLANDRFSTTPHPASKWLSENR
jgi:hypothetical protein